MAEPGGSLEESSASPAEPPIAEQLQSLSVASAPATTSSEHPSDPEDKEKAPRRTRLPLEGRLVEGAAATPPALTEGEAGAESASPVQVASDGGARGSVPCFGPLERPVADCGQRDAEAGGKPPRPASRSFRPGEGAGEEPGPRQGEKPPRSPGAGASRPGGVKKGDPKEGLADGQPETPENGNKAGRERSGPSSESDSESDSDTSTDSSSSSCLAILSEDDDLECSSKNNSASVRKKSELSEDSVPVEDLNIILPQSVELMPFGKISGIIDHLVIIESQKGLPPVNEDTVLFSENRHSIGKVFEVFGPVWHPYYVVQFNSPEHLASKSVKVHDAVYFAPSIESFTQYIFPEKLKQEKGSDASWKNDEEPPLEALDYSDDEKEKAAKQQKKSQNAKRKKPRTQWDDSNGDGLQCQPRRQHPLDYSNRYCRGGSNPRFARGRFPHSSAPPNFFSQEAKPPQYYSKYSQRQKPPAFSYQQNQDPSRREQFGFQPPPFETVRNEAGFPPCPPVNWGWSPGYTQNPYDPLLSLLSMPPPPPPPLPPPPTQLNSAHYP